MCVLRCAAGRPWRALLCFVERLGNPMGSLCNAVHRRVQLVEAAFAQRAARLFDCFFGRLDVGLGQLFTIFLDQLLRLVDKVVEPVASLDLSATAPYPRPSAHRLLSSCARLLPCSSPSKR